MTVMHAGDQAGGTMPVAGPAPAERASSCPCEACASVTELASCVADLVRALQRSSNPELSGFVFRADALAKRFRDVEQARGPRR